MSSIIRVAIVEDEPGRRLHLAGRVPRGSARAPRWITRLLPGRPSDADDVPRRLLSFNCDAEREQLVICDVIGPGLPIREEQVRLADIAGVRLRAVGREDGGLVLRLTLRLLAPEPRQRCFSFRVAALDRQEEVFELALTMARCLGLRGYRIRQQEPADIVVERSGTADSRSPYRHDVGLLAVPAAGLRLDLPAMGEREFVPPGAGIEAFSPDMIHKGDLTHTLERFEPGEELLLTAPGRTRGVSMLLTLLLWGPPAAILFPLLVTVAWGLSLLVVELALGLAIALALALKHVTGIPVGKTAVDVAGVLLIVLGLALGAISFIGGTQVTYRFLRERYQGGLRHGWELAYDSHELIETSGGLTVRFVPLEQISAVIARTEVDAPTVELERSGAEDIRLMEWQYMGARQSVAARSVATALAKSIGVPVRFSPSIDRTAP